MSHDSFAADRARQIRSAIPAGGLFDGATWRISPEPFALGESLAKELDSLGRVLLQFYRAVNLLYRRSVEGKAPAWVAELLDQGKPAERTKYQVIYLLVEIVPFRDALHGNLPSAAKTSTDHRVTKWRRQSSAFDLLPAWNL